MRLYLRNKATGEIRDVEADSAEYHELQAQVTSAGLSMWEQTSFAAAEGIKDRAEAGELREEDLGHEHQDELRYEAIRLNSEGVAPEANPHLALTPAEIEAGLTPESKLQELEQMYADRTGRTAVLNKASKAISGKEPPKPKSGEGASARSGGSDAREKAPLPSGGE